MGNGTVRSIDFICNTNTFSIKACGETFKIQSGKLDCNFLSEGRLPLKMQNMWRSSLCWEGKFRARFNNYKSAHWSYRKKP